MFGDQHESNGALPWNRPTEEDFTSREEGGTNRTNDNQGNLQCQFQLFKKEKLNKKFDRNIS